MKGNRLSHLPDHVLLRELVTLASQDCVTTADLLAHIAEVDERGLYLSAGYPSMYKFCVHALHMSEDVAYKRIQAARAAREFPAILPAVAAGRLHLTGVVRIAPHLRPENAGELLVAAEHKTTAEIELLLAERFPRLDVPTLLSPVGPPSADVSSAAQMSAQLVSKPVAALTPQPEPERTAPPTPSLSTAQLVSKPVVAPTPQPVAASPARARVAPLSAGRFALQVTVDQETREQLRYAQELLGHAVPSGDVAEVLKRALNLLVQKLEQKKFAKSGRSRPKRGSANPRYVPAAVRRAVWQRDDGMCTFVGQNGKRCEECSRLEFDHIEPLAGGGRTVASNLRLRCRAHNQHAADGAFGGGFMRGKRDQARRGAQQARAQAGASEPAPAASAAR